MKDLKALFHELIKLYDRKSTLEFSLSVCKSEIDKTTNKLKDLLDNGKFP